MCDTLGIGPGLTGCGAAVFGKNSDREADEAQVVLSIPGEANPGGRVLRCTYISIPQADFTYGIVISKPFWIWGAEMGVNEMGVAIGNEALFTKVKQEKSPGLIGMDLLRLALERAATADEAAHVIIRLLGQYGQAGPCGWRDKKFGYMNSFLIMDPAKILTLETVGRDHAVKQHRDHAAISNRISITADWDESSLATGTDFSAFTDPVTTYFAGSSFRKGSNDDSILGAKAPIGVSDVFRMLRRHYGQGPSKGFNRDVCMHASDPLIRRSQTTGSMVAELHPDRRVRIFVTAGSAPCLTPFKPFLPAAPYPDAGIGGGSFSDASYWWRHEVFHLNAMLRYDSIMPGVRAWTTERERDWIERVPAHAWDCTDGPLVEASHTAFLESERNEQFLLAGMGSFKRAVFSLSGLFRRRMALRSEVPLV